jgi:predicted TIM-barrel fold metal-dependent hydrolase
MLIDINAYIGHWPFRQLRGNSLESLLERMDGFGVDKAIVANINGIFYKDCQTANRELFDAIDENEAFRDRFIPFATMNPMLPWWRDSLEICHKELGMKGIRLYPVYHHYDIANEESVALVKAAKDLGMPISIPLRMIDIRQRGWLDVDQVLDLNHIASLVERVPDAKYMVLDTRVGRGRITSEISTQILQKANVLFDTVRGSGVPTTGYTGVSLKYLLDTFGIDKMAFGTETPFIDYCTPFIRLEVFKEITENEKSKIWSGNVIRMLQD